VFLLKSKIPSGPRTLLESRLELALLGAFEDGEEAPTTADAGAGEPAVPLLPTAPSAFAAYGPIVRRFSSGGARMEGLGG